MTQDNKALVRRYREAHNRNNLTLLDEIVATDIQSHDGTPGFPPGLEGGKQVHQMFLAAFPDGRVTTEDVISEGDKVVERFSFKGTNTGPSWVHPPRARRLQLQACPSSASPTARLSNTGVRMTRWAPCSNLAWFQCQENRHQS
jgi:predicted ester cyclase